MQLHYVVGFRIMVASHEHSGITVSGLRKAFGSVTAVDQLSFTVTPGTVTGFLGPNGAGKTTTLRMLLGLVRPDEGEALIDGQRYVDLPRPTERVGAALEAGFHPARSARNHLRAFCTVSGFPASRAEEALELVGLRDAVRRAVGGYSLGMRQRLALATALLGDPSVLVLDEPGNGLDPEGIAWMRRMLREFAAQGRTVLVSSHVLSEVQQLVDEVVIINRGRLVAQGSLSDLPRSASQVTSVRTPTPDRLLAALTRTASSAGVVRVGSDTVKVTGMSTEQVGAVAFEASIQLHELASERSDLEEVFFSLTNGTGADPALREVG